MVQDLAYATRLLWRAPAYVSAVTMPLTLGIGFAVVAFTVVDGVLLKPLPYRDPERLVATRRNLTPEEIAGLRECASLEGVGAYSFEAQPLVLDGEPSVRVRQAQVTADFLPVLGVRPMIGGGIREDAGARAVLVTHGLWVDRFAADPSVVGRVVGIDRRPYVVAGVLPPSFLFPTSSHLLAPRVLVLVESKTDSSPTFAVIARLAPGSTQAQAEAEITTLTANRSSETVLGTSEPLLLSLRRQMLEQTPSATLLLLSGAVGCLVLIACANVGTLLLIRAIARGPELAILSALGASSRRLIQRVLAETLVLSGIGAVGGVVVAWLTLPSILAMMPASMLRGDRVTIDLRVLAVTALICVSAAVIAGLASASWSCRPGVSRHLRQRLVPPGGSRRLIAGFVAIELALGTALTCGAGLLLKSYERLRQVDVGFDADRVAVARVVLPSRYADSDLSQDYYRTVLERLRRLPSVDAAGGIDLPPLVAFVRMTPFEVLGNPLDVRAVELRTVLPGYFAALQVPVLAGRDFADDDRGNAPGVAIVNNAFTQAYWKGHLPVGEDIHFAKGRRKIVGVVGDIRTFAVTESPRPLVYVPASQDRRRDMMLVVKATMSASALAARLPGELRAVDPAVGAEEVGTMSALVRSSIARPRLEAVLVSAFAVAALLLGSVGTYTVVAYAAARRRRETALRVALGANPLRVGWLFVREALRPALLGVGVGLTASYWFGRVLQRLLFQVSPHDWWVLASVPVVLLCLVVAAAWWPARRAAGAEPIAVLRGDEQV